MTSWFPGPFPALGTFSHYGSYIVNAAGEKYVSVYIHYH